MNRFSLLSLVCFSAIAFARPVSAAGNSNFGPFTIKVEIEGVTQGVFQSVEGLVSESQVVSSEENGVVSEAPGPLKGSRLILKRPYDPLLRGLWRWRKSVLDQAPEKRDGNIFIFNGMGQVVAHWIFLEGWPCRWEVPALKGASREPAEEVVEIVHAGLSLVAGSGQ